MTAHRHNHGFSMILAIVIISLLTSVSKVSRFIFKGHGSESEIVYRLTSFCSIYKRVFAVINQVNRGIYVNN
jgi:hypothetical protein